jgi:glycosyltransferase involved in cell wall biosynthesis
VARTRYRLPLEGALERKWEALAQRMDVRVLATSPRGAAPGDDRFRLVPQRLPSAVDGAAFYSLLPARVAAELRRFRPTAVVAQGPHAAYAALRARSLVRIGAGIALEVHGDWRTSTRLYGSRARVPLSPLADRVARTALRGADAVRTLSPFTTQLVRELGVEPAVEFPAYVDLASFLERPPEPLPEQSQALFVGVLERYKHVDGLVAAWREAAPRTAGARLRFVGDGTLRNLVADLVDELPEQTFWEPRLAQTSVAQALDASSLLVLPSRSEGLPRIAIESLCRGRPVLGARAGGIPDIVEDGVNGILVEPEDPTALAGALSDALRRPGSLEPLAARCRPSAERWIHSPDEYADRVLELVEVAARRARAKPGYSYGSEKASSPSRL